MADKIDAEARETFCKKEKTIDMRKKRVTDLKLNNMVKLPKGLSIIEESEIVMRTKKLKVEKIKKRSTLQGVKVKSCQIDNRS